MRAETTAGRGPIRAFGLLLLGLAMVSDAPRLAGQPLPASLIADAVSYDRDRGLLTATGNVEVLYQGRVLRASRIVYDERADEIRATGPIALSDPAGGVLLADAATMSADLREGLIRSARLLIADQLQVAATEVRRTGGRYTSLYRTIASSCTICAGSNRPTWALRAARVTQDAEAQRIYFEDATLELFGVPVGYLPRLSIPDPAVGRASGVLVPEVRQSDIYGFGLKAPFYRVLGPSADATVTPFVTSRGASLIEGEYRRAFDSGGLAVSGVLALDDGLGGDPWRGVIAALGRFALPRGFTGAFDLNAASDESFLQQFDYSDADRLTSTADISRTRARDFTSLGAIAFQSLREDEQTRDIPFILPEFSYRRLYDPPGVGGRLGVEMHALGLMRTGGRDVLRAAGGLDWRRDWVLPRGVLAAALARGDLDLYRVSNDGARDDGAEVRATPGIGAEISWPLARQTGAAMHLVEPIAQLFYSDALGDADVPNEDSQLPEFDETNLFSQNRFPGQDRVETGLRANLGLRYTRFDPTGWTLGVTLGRAARFDSAEGFYQGAGLAGRWSGYVGAVSLDLVSGLQVTNRLLLDRNLDFDRNEFALAYDGDRAGIAAAYIYLAGGGANPLLGPQTQTSEIAIEARYRFDPNWELRGNWRYDTVADSNIRAGGGLTYGNECAEFDLSVSRRYTSSSSVPPSTSVGFAVRLAGLGGSIARDWPAPVCVGRGI